MGVECRILFHERRGDSGLGGWHPVCRIAVAAIFRPSQRSAAAANGSAGAPADASSATAKAVLDRNGRRWLAVHHGLNLSKGRFFGKGGRLAGRNPFAVAFESRRLASEVRFSFLTANIRAVFAARPPSGGPEEPEEFAV
jgi:hypothetical protein